MAGHDGPCYDEHGDWTPDHIKYMRGPVLYYGGRLAALGMYLLMVLVVLAVVLGLLGGVADWVGHLF